MFCIPEPADDAILTIFSKKLMAYKPKAGVKVKLKKQKLIWKYGGLDTNGFGGFLFR